MLRYVTEDFWDWLIENLKITFKNFQYQMNCKTYV